MGCVGHPGVKWLKPFSNSIGVSENGGDQKNALYLGKWWLTSVFGWYPVFKQTRMCGLVGPQNCAGFVRDTRLAGGSIWGILPFKKHHMALRNSAPYTRKNSFRDPSEWRLKEKPLGHYNFFAPRNPAIRAHFNGPASMDPSRPLKFQGCEWV
jgi:hypothetical protein